MLATFQNLVNRHDNIKLDTYIFQINRVSTSCSVEGSENTARFEDDDFGKVDVIRGIKYIIYNVQD